LRKIIARSSWFVALYLILVSPVYAAVPCPAPGGGVQIADCFGYGKITFLAEGIKLLVPPAFSIAVTLVILYFLFGAFKYLKAGDSKEEVAGGREMIQHAIIGFVILMFAFLTIQFLLSNLFGNIGLKLIGP
jgi:Na+/H+ antiporter NhaD/arsenite permease-like protein